MCTRLWTLDFDQLRYCLREKIWMEERERWASQLEGSQDVSRTPERGRKFAISLWLQCVLKIQARVSLTAKNERGS